MESMDKEAAKQSETLASDLLNGAAEIAQFLGTNAREVYHLAKTQRLLIGRLGRKLIAFKAPAHPPHRQARARSHRRLKTNPAEPRPPRGSLYLASRARERPERKAKMLQRQSIPAPTVGVHPNGRSGSPNCARPYRRPRLLYRTGITNIELDAPVGEIGIERVMAALDRATQPAAPSASAANDEGAPAEWWTEMMYAPHAVAAE